MKRIVFSCFLLFAACYGVSAQPLYTLDELKRLAVENNYTLRSARNAIEQSKEQQQQAFTMFFPTVQAFGVAVDMDKPLIEMDLNLPAQLSSLLPPGVNLPTSVSMLKNGVFGSVSAIQPVFAGGTIVGSNRLAKVGAQANEIQLEDSEDKVTRATELYYWQLVSLKEKMLTLEKMHGLLVELEKDVTLRVNAGIVNRNDLLQVQLRRGEIEAQMAEVAHASATLSELLAQHVGLPASGNGENEKDAIDVVIDANLTTATVPDFPLSLKKDHQAVLSSTPTYRLLEKNVESQQILKRIKVGQNLPAVGVGASYSYNNFMDRSRSGGAVFATVSIPISGWWGGSHSIKKQDLALQDAREQLTDSGEKLIIQMNRAWSAVETSHKKLVIAHDAITQADENLRLNRDYYRAGMTKMTDLLLAQQQYQQARDRFTDAYADFQTKQLEYRQATAQE